MKVEKLKVEGELLDTLCSERYVGTNIHSLNLLLFTDTHTS